MQNNKISKLLPVTDDKTLTYIKLRKEYKDYANKKKVEFISRYKNSISNLDDLAIKTNKIVKDILSESIDKCLSTLVGLGIYDISKEKFILTYFDPYDTWKIDFQSIQDKYDKITLTAFEMAHKRDEAAKTSSGGVIGGGMGIEGAAQGIAIATAANLAISAVKGLSNSIGSAADNAKIKKDKDDYFQKSDLLQALASNFEKLIFSTHFAIVDFVNSSSNESTIYAFPTSDEIDKSNAILENIVSGRLSSDKAVELIPQAIKLNPYNLEIYKYWLSEHGDYNNDLTTVTEFYGVDGLQKHKNSLFEIAFLKLDTTTPQMCDESIIKITEYGKFLFIENIDEWTIKIKTKSATLTEQINKIDIATKILSEKGLKIAVPSLGISKSANEIVEIAIESAISERMKRDGSGWVEVFGITGVASLFFALPLGIFLIVVAIIKYRNKKRAHRTAILAEGQAQLVRNSYIKGTPHAKHPNVVWNGTGMLIPADGYDWDSAGTEYAVKAVPSP